NDLPASRLFRELRINCSATPTAYPNDGPIRSQTYVVPFYHSGERKTLLCGPRRARRKGPLGQFVVKEKQAARVVPNQLQFLYHIIGCRLFFHLFRHEPL